MWYVTQETPSWDRIHHGFLWVSVDCCDPAEDSLWFEEASQTWKSLSECTGPCSSSHLGPRTLKAFRRYLRKHPELKGRRVRLVHRCYVPGADYGLDITAEWRPD